MGRITEFLENVGSTFTPVSSEGKPQAPSTLQKCGCALAIILGLAALATAAVGLAGHLGAINGFTQVDTIVMMAAGGGGGAFTFIVGVIASVRTHRQAVFMRTKFV